MSLREAGDHLPKTEKNENIFSIHFHFTEKLFIFLHPFSLFRKTVFHFLFHSNVFFFCIWLQLVFHCYRSDFDL